MRRRCSAGRDKARDPAIEQRSTKRYTELTSSPVPPPLPTHTGSHPHSLRYTLHQPATPVADCDTLNPSPHLHSAYTTQAA